MKTIALQPVAIACLFTWIGFVCAISFMEAWLKFQAPGVTLPIGLGIGKLVFTTLNRTEWIFAAVVTGSALFHWNQLYRISNLFLAAVLVILLAQTFWMLPVLNARALLHIHGEPVPPSRLHLWFIIAEVAKVISLFVVAFALFKQSK